MLVSRQGKSEYRNPKQIQITETQNPKLVDSVSSANKLLGQALRYTQGRQQWLDSRLRGNDKLMRENDKLMRGNDRRPNINYELFR